LTSVSWLRATFRKKDCLGATPKPARETRALPRVLPSRKLAWFSWIRLKR
jgi:hypothetical protein